MKKLLTIALLPALTGCLSFTATNVERQEWTVEAKAETKTVESAKYGVARLSQVSVRSPYDVRNFTVHRKDLSTAFDPYNLFASSPAQLLKGPLQDCLEKSGLFAAVVSSSSSAVAPYLVEVTITELALDCTEDENDPDRRDAVVALSVLVLDSKRGIVASAKGEAREDAKSGEYATAFSKALTNAAANAMEKL